AYSFGLIALIMIKVLPPGFYARPNIKTPVKITICTLICTQLMNRDFSGPLTHVGLSLDIGLGACINAGLLVYLLRRHGIYHPG
ncbi:lipid II flippase MurJ, partial [Neisseria meningitidis]|uniref:lipid II flippase MurJ n=1 Tax=Neisseria meningitidis TaxID=487 RepID=UPI000CB13BE0